MAVSLEWELRSVIRMNYSFTLCYGCCSYVIFTKSATMCALWYMHYLWTHKTLTLLQMRLCQCPISIELCDLNQQHSKFEIKHDFQLLVGRRYMAFLAQSFVIFLLISCIFIIRPFLYHLKLCLVCHFFDYFKA